jgi:DNA mismatch endonuclease (patch repair protein)
MLRSALHRRGFRFRLHRRDLTGCPDLVFARERVCVFVDGDFWHARAFRQRGVRAIRSLVRGSRQAWWITKLRRNAERDDEVSTALTEHGWRVVRVWESAIFSKPEGVAARVERVLRKRRKPRMTAKKPSAKH